MRSGTNNRIKKSVGLGRKKETITPCPEIMWTATQKKLLSAPLQIDLYPVTNRSLLGNRSVRNDFISL